MKNRFGDDPFHSNTTYVCGICGKRTRDTGYGEAGNDSCKRCYVESGLENQHNDRGHDATVFEAGYRCPACPNETNETIEQIQKRYDQELYTLNTCTGHTLQRACVKRLALLQAELDARQGERN